MLHKIRSNLSYKVCTHISYNGILSCSHPPPLTPHPSPLTPHPSPLIPYPSPLTPHPSPLIPYPSPLTPHPSPLTPHPSPLTPLPSPRVVRKTLKSSLVVSSMACMRRWSLQRRLWRVTPATTTVSLSPLHLHLTIHPYIDSLRTCSTKITKLGR